MNDRFDNVTLKDILDNAQILDQTNLDLEAAAEETPVSIGDKGVEKSINLLEVASLHLQGFSTKDIAERLGTTNYKITGIKRSDDFKDMTKLITLEVKDKAKDFLASLSIKAVQTFAEGLNSPNDKVRLDSAKEILNRAGIKSAEQIEIKTDNPIEQLSDEELKSIIALGVGEVIHIEPNKDSEGKD